MRLVRTACAAAISFAAGISLSLLAAAQTSGDGLFSGKTLHVVLGYPPGGGYDVYGRLFAEHIVRFLPSVQATVQYMPGAATELAAGYIVDVAPQDGTYIGVPVSSLPISTYLQHKPGEGVNVAALRWIGRLDALDTVTTIRSDLGISALSDTLRRQLVLGGTTTTTTSFAVPTALIKLGKLDARLVLGYGGATDAYLAMDRGEIDGTALSVWSQLKRTKTDWIRDRKVKVLYQMSERRAADLQDVPSLVDLATDDVQRRIFRLLSSEGTVGRAFYVGPKVPDDRVVALRRAFDRMVVDPQFKAAAAALDTTLDPLSGADMEAFIKSISQFSPELFQEARALTSPTP